jgi:hypothetical protein
MDESWMDESWMDESWMDESWMDESWMDESWMDESWMDESSNLSSRIGSINGDSSNSMGFIGFLDLGLRIRILILLSDT